MAGNVCIDVVFPAPTKVARICFRNWYTGHLTIRATTDRSVLARKETSNIDGWVALVCRPAFPAIAAMQQAGQVHMCDSEQRSRTPFWHRESLGIDTKSIA